MLPTDFASIGLNPRWGVDDCRRLYLDWLGFQLIGGLYRCRPCTELIKICALRIRLMGALCE